LQVLDLLLVGAVDAVATSGQRTSGDLQLAGRRIDFTIAYVAIWLGWHRIDVGQGEGADTFRSKRGGIEIHIAADLKLRFGDIAGIDVDGGGECAAFVELRVLAVRRIEEVEARSK